MRVWRERLEFPETPRRGFAAVVQRLLRPVFNRMLEADRARQTDFNLAMLEMLSDLRGDLQTAHDDIRSLHGDFRGFVSTQLPVAVRRNDALFEALDRKLENVSARARDLSIELLRKQHEQETIRAGDFVYRRLEDGLRGSEDEIRAAILPYVDMARAHPPVLDLGCGRGEFLRVCAQQGIEAHGFDTNALSVASLRDEGIEVSLGGIPDCLRELEADSVGSILASHVVEHLPSDVLLVLFAESARILRQGGLLMIETPNAESLVAGSVEFWRDPTHLAPKHPAALTLIARELGFGIEEIRGVSPFPSANLLRVDESQPDDIRLLAQRLNEILFGEQNLRLVLRKL